MSILWFDNFSGGTVNAELSTYNGWSISVSDPNYKVYIRNNLDIPNKSIAFFSPASGASGGTEYKASIPPMRNFIFTAKLWFSASLLARGFDIRFDSSNTPQATLVTNTAGEIYFRFPGGGPYPVGTFGAWHNIKAMIYENGGVYYIKGWIDNVLKYTGGAMSSPPTIADIDNIRVVPYCSTNFGPDNPPRDIIAWESFVMESIPLPSAPTIVSIIPNNKFITLTTVVNNTDPLPATQVEIWRGTSSGGETYLTTVAPGIFINTPLNDDTTYYYKARAINAVGTGPFGNEASAHTWGPPSAPRSLTANRGLGSISLSWLRPSYNPNIASTQYQIYRRILITDPWSFIGTKPGLTAEPIIYTDDGGIPPDQHYFYKVTDTNIIGEGAGAFVDSTTYAVPSAPQSPSAVSAGIDITVSWQAPASDGGTPVTNYKIYRGTSSGGEVYHDIVGNINAYVDTAGLIALQVYYYKITAVNAAGEGAPSTEISKIFPTNPDPPTGLVAVATGVNSIDLSWLPPANTGGTPLTGFKIYRGTSPSGEGATPVAILGPGQLTYSDTGLVSEVAFYYVVKAVNIVGDSLTFSNEAFAVPMSIPVAPEAPTISVNSRAKYTVLSWQRVTKKVDGVPIQNVLRYQVYRSKLLNESDRELIKIITTTDAADKIDTIFLDLSDSNTLVYRVTAVIIDGGEEQESLFSDRSVAIRLPSQIDGKTELPDRKILVWNFGNWNQTLWS